MLLRPQTPCPAASRLPGSGEPGDIAGSTKMSLAGSCGTAPQSECDAVIALGGPRLISPGQGEPGPEAFAPGALSVVSTVSIRPVASSRRPAVPRGTRQAALTDVGREKSADRWVSGWHPCFDGHPSIWFPRWEGVVVVTYISPESGQWVGSATCRVLDG